MNGAFTLVDVTAPPADLLSGAQLQVRSVAAGVTEFARPEDGHWDTQLNRVFYFVTTGASIGGATQTARLYKLTFDDIRQSDRRGPLRVSSSTLRRSWARTAPPRGRSTTSPSTPRAESWCRKIRAARPTSPRSGRSILTGQTAPLQIFESDRARFISGTPTFLTTDEENSGIIEVTSLVRSAAWFDPTRRYYLGVTQAHYGNGPMLVEGGQFYLMASASSEGAR